ncbi:hypothetical protein HQ576_13315 [bacterium]|nr:hypothetical protein [bacterium]
MTEHNDDSDSAPDHEERAYRPTGSFVLDHGACSACGSKTSSVLDIGGQCAAPGCPNQICKTCWDIKGRRTCAEHTDSDG